ncbi:MAG: hypothetical protein WBX25_08270 [Rhodomicrobium sp.]
MNEATAALISQFEGAAKNAKEAEATLRRTMAAEIARHEREREFAFRRTRLIRLLTSSAAALPTEDEAVLAQCRAVREEFGWHAESEAYKSILEEIRPLALAVWLCVCETQTGSAEAVAAELAKFEAWFQARRGTPFYALFDQYFPDAPLVDF